MSRAQRDLQPSAIMETTRYGAAVTEQLSALTLITCLLAFSGARHFLAATIPPREREALTVAFGLYFLFGTVTDLCASTGTTPPLICGVFSLSYYVIRILLIFCILIFFNMAADTIRRSSGHSWPQLKGEILRLVAYRQLRLRVLVVYLVLPIVFMFMEVCMRCCCKRDSLKLSLGCAVLRENLRSCPACVLRRSCSIGRARG